MISVWCVTDDKTGHKNQLRGLVNALSKIREVDCRWLSIHDKSNWPSGAGPTLIFAVGSSTVFPALQLRWRYGGKIVLLMKPFWPLWLFDLCLFPRHDGVKPSRRVFTTIGAINPVDFSGRSDPNCGLILIGGSAVHYNWSDSDLIDQVLQLISSQHHVSWTLTTSRRTPASFLPALERALASEQIESVVKLVPLEQTGGNWLVEHYRDCGLIWVTEDSVSMVYESLSSGAKTGILSVPRLKDGRVSRGLDQLTAEGRVMTLKAGRVINSTVSDPLREAEKAALIVIEQLL